jgi:hypothetical protein
VFRERLAGCPHQIARKVSVTVDRYWPTVRADDRQQLGCSIECQLQDCSIDHIEEHSRPIGDIAANGFVDAKLTLKMA